MFPWRIPACGFAVADSKVAPERIARLVRDKNLAEAGAVEVGGQAEGMCVSAPSAPGSPDNIPAFRLYDRAGFGQVCGYHCRTAG